MEILKTLIESREAKKGEGFAHQGRPLSAFMTLILKKPLFPEGSKPIPFKPKNRSIQKSAMERTASFLFYRCMIFKKGYALFCFTFPFGCSTIPCVILWLASFDADVDLEGLIQFREIFWICLSKREGLLPR